VAVGVLGSDGSGRRGGRVGTHLSMDGEGQGRQLSAGEEEGGEGES
jgi:hypothetical protein